MTDPEHPPRPSRLVRADLLVALALGALVSAGLAAEPLALAGDERLRVADAFLPRLPHPELEGAPARCRAFPLVATPDPWGRPWGWRLVPTGRPTPADMDPGTARFEFDALRRPLGWQDRTSGPVTTLVYSFGPDGLDGRGSRGTDDVSLLRSHVNRLHTLDLVAHASAGLASLLAVAWLLGRLSGRWPRGRQAALACGVALIACAATWALCPRPVLALGILGLPSPEEIGAPLAVPDARALQLTVGLLLALVGVAGRGATPA